MKITFPVVRLWKKKRVNCVCGKSKMSRSKTFEATINQFNKNAAGEQKTRAEVLADLKAEADKWETQREVCHNCPNKTQALRDKAEQDKPTDNKWGEDNG